MPLTHWTSGEGHGMTRDAIDFESITITDDLMFGTVFQDPELCRGLIEMIPGIKVRDLQFVQRQAWLDAGPLSRAGIVDLLVRDADGNECDIEMQNVATPDIVFRARRYLSLVDLSMLDRGQRFEEAGGAVGIFICANDPFGDGWKRYEYPRQCRETGRPLGDRTNIVFVNAKGTKGELGDGFDAFLQYLSNDTVIRSDYVRRVNDAVQTYRDDPKWRRFRMLWSEKYRDEIADAMQAGRKEGLEEGAKKCGAQLARLAREMDSRGRSAEFMSALEDGEKIDRLLDEFHLA